VYLLQVLGVAAITKVFGLSQLLRAAFERVVLPALQFFYTLGIVVEADVGSDLSEFNRKRQSHVA
jgi:hypothetical protein